MNKIEKLVYNSIKNNPKVKSYIRDIYQLVMYCLPSKKIQTEFEIFTHPGYFFGFHDKVPFSADNRFLLAHKLDRKYTLSNNSNISIGYFYDLKYNEFNELAKTNAWNYQQGSMLQWVGRSNNIIFNKYDENTQTHIALIIDVKGNVIKRLPRAIGAIDPKGEYALSYSFERLRKGMPGYGYANGYDEDDLNLIPNKGLELVDLQKGEARLLFKIQDLIDIDYDKTMENSFHFFTHCLFSPSGERFLFFHRWLNGSKRLKTRMFTADVDGNNLHMFQTEGMVSHVSWANENQILGYAETKDGAHYHLFTDKTNGYKIIGENYFNCDGHPQFSSDYSQFITDTYPDRRRIQKLILFAMNHNEGKVIGSFRSPLRYKNAFRCDLHPRWDRNGSLICFDSTYLGERSLSILNLDRNINVID